MSGLKALIINDRQNVGVRLQCVRRVVRGLQLQRTASIQGLDRKTLFFLKSCHSLQCLKSRSCLSDLNILKLLTITMWWTLLFVWGCATWTVAQSTEGLYRLVQRRLPNHVDRFHFSINSSLNLNSGYDQFSVHTSPNGTVLVEGSSISALSSG